MTNNTILVIGSTGNTGKRAADQLNSLGIPVRHGSRGADIPCDREDQQTWAPAVPPTPAAPPRPACGRPSAIAS